VVPLSCGAYCGHATLQLVQAARHHAPANSSAVVPAWRVVSQYVLFAWLPLRPAPGSVQTVTRLAGTITRDNDAARPRVTLGLG
jgi:hypothetical protein